MPVLVLDLDRCAVVKGLVETDPVPPVHPLEGSDLNLKNIFPSMDIDQLVLIRAVDVLGQRIVVRIPNAPGPGSDPRISEPIVIHNRDILTPMIAVVNQLIGLLRAGDGLVQRL